MKTFLIKGRLFSALTLSDALMQSIA